MIDGFAWYSIVIRLITLLVAVFVINRIYNLIIRVTKDQWIKYLLAFLITIVVGNAAWALGVNFFRQEDGNLRERVRHTSLVLTSTSGLASIIGWYVLLRKDE